MQNSDKIVLKYKLNYEYPSHYVQSLLDSMPKGLFELYHLDNFLKFLLNNNTSDVEECTYKICGQHRLDHETGVFLCYIISINEIEYFIEYDMYRKYLKNDNVVTFVFDDLDCQSDIIININKKNEINKIINQIKPELDLLNLINI